MVRAVFISAVFLVVPLLAIAGSPLEGPLVPQCEGPTCNVCHFVELARNVLRFGSALAGLLAIGLFIYIGVMHAAGALKYARIASAQKSLSKVVFGFVLLLSAWLLVDLGISVFTGKGIRPWTSFSCGAIDWNSISSDRSPLGLNQGISPDLGSTTVIPSTGGRNGTAENGGEGIEENSTESDEGFEVVRSRVIDNPDGIVYISSVTPLLVIPEDASCAEGLRLLRENAVNSDNEVMYLYVVKNGKGRWVFLGVGTRNSTAGINWSERIDEEIRNGADSVHIFHTHPDEPGSGFSDGGPPSFQDVRVAHQQEKKYGSRAKIREYMVNKSGLWSLSVPQNSSYARRVAVTQENYLKLALTPGLNDRFVAIRKDNPSLDFDQALHILIMEALNGDHGPEAQKNAVEYVQVNNTEGLGNLLNRELAIILSKTMSEAEKNQALIDLYRSEGVLIEQETIGDDEACPLNEGTVSLESPLILFRAHQTTGYSCSS